MKYIFLFLIATTFFACNQSSTEELNYLEHQNEFLTRQINTNIAKVEDSYYRNKLKFGDVKILADSLTFLIAAVKDKEKSDGISYGRDIETQINGLAQILNKLDFYRFKHYKKQAFIKDKDLKQDILFLRDYKAFEAKRIVNNYLLIANEISLLLMIQPEYSNFKFSGIYSYVNTDKRIYSINDTLKAEAFFIVHDSVFRPYVNINNTKVIPNKWGTGNYKLKLTKKGNYTLNGEIRTPNPTGRDTLLYRFEKPYTVK